jgi:hypothetical protein
MYLGYNMKIQRALLFTLFGAAAGGGPAVDGVGEDAGAGPAARTRSTGRAANPGA